MLISSVGNENCIEFQMQILQITPVTPNVSLSYLEFLMMSTVKQYEKPEEHTTIMTLLLILLCAGQILVCFL